MKIAVTYEAGIVFQHFGHTANFKIYDVENNQVVASQVVDTCGQGHGALAGFLQNLGVDTLICGGIGGGARVALGEVNITVYGGVRGDCDEVVSDFLAGQLSYDPCARCTHHDHDHEHACGSHGCGSHG